VDDADAIADFLDLGEHVGRQEDRGAPFTRLVEQPLGICSWALGIAVFTAVEAAVVPSAIKLANNTSGQLKQVLARHLATLTPNQYVCG
jgi:hypothetical protein